MKYKNQPKIGAILGSYYGRMLSNLPYVKTIEGIVAVPLHPKRLKERGYNQSAFFAQALSDRLNIPFYADCIIRIRDTPSQTKKSKEARKTNLQNAFKVTQPQLITTKHLLLVDDILTTGATLASCTQVLLAQGVKQISIAAIAVVEEPSIR